MRWPRRRKPEVTFRWVNGLTYLDTPEGSYVFPGATLAEAFKTAAPIIRRDCGLEDGDGKEER